MAAPPPSLLDSPLFEPALLRVASRRAAALSDAARERMKPWVNAAQARYRVALELRDPETRGVALGLLRDAAFLALVALEASAAQSELAESPLTAWQRFGTSEASSAAPACLARAREAWVTADLPALDRLAAADDGALRPAAEETVAWLLTLCEVRSQRELARARLVRSAFALLAAVLIAGALFAYWSVLSALSAPPH